MKIALLKGGLGSLGGLEKTTVALAEAFAKRGEVIILSCGDAPVKVPGVEIISVCKKPGLHTFDLACHNWLKKNPCDVVFGMERNSSQTHYRAGSGVHAAFLKRRALIDSKWKLASFRWNPHHRNILALEKKCMETTPTLFTNSEMVKKEIQEHYKAGEINVVHNGAPLIAWERHFQNTFTEDRAGPFRFLFVGQGFKRKGLSFLLQALSLIKEEYHLDVVGKDKDLGGYQDQCVRLGINKKVTFWGAQKDIPPFYQRADCLVIPSIYDPFANVTTEALAMGLFVISSAFNGGCEVLTEENGRVIEKLGDAESLKKCLEEALKRPKSALSAEKIRNSIQGLDFSSQLEIIVRKTLETK